MSELILRLNSGIIYDTYERPTMIIDTKNKTLMAIAEYDMINPIFDNIKLAYSTVPEQSAEDIIMLELDCQYTLDNSYLDIDYAIKLYENIQEQKDRNYELLNKLDTFKDDNYLTHLEIEQVYNVIDIIQKRSR